jgi:Protein of unknown function (DUF3147)
MQIKVDLSALRQAEWHQYAIRFFFGGLVTAIAGIIAKEFGAAIGGLFLAFPAIFPGSATLIEKHETEKKEREGLHGTERGRDAASIDAAGSAMGKHRAICFRPTSLEIHARPQVMVHACRCHSSLAGGFRADVAPSKTGVQNTKTATWALRH